MSNKKVYVLTGALKEISDVIVYDNITGRQAIDKIQEIAENNATDDIPKHIRNILEIILGYADLREIGISCNKIVMMMDSILNVYIEAQEKFDESPSDVLKENVTVDMRKTRQHVDGFYVWKNLRKQRWEVGKVGTPLHTIIPFSKYAKLCIMTYIINKGKKKPTEFKLKENT